MFSTNCTLSIIKPDAVSRNLIGNIYQRFEMFGLKIIASKMLHLSKTQAEKFYAVHKDKYFFADLVTFMSSGPIMVQVLYGENAVIKNRQVMGATDPQEALPNTIRADFGESVRRNAVHGSDSIENAQTEIAFFFQDCEIFYPKLYFDRQ